MLTSTPFETRSSGSGSGSRSTAYTSTWAISGLTRISSCLTSTSETLASSRLSRPQRRTSTSTAQLSTLRPSQTQCFTTSIGRAMRLRSIKCSFCWISNRGGVDLQTMWTSCMIELTQFEPASMRCTMDPRSSSTLHKLRWMMPLPRSKKRALNYQQLEGSSCWSALASSSSSLATSCFFQFVWFTNLPCSNSSRFWS